MLKMCRELGFEVKINPEHRGFCEATLVLDRLLKDETHACDYRDGPHRTSGWV